MDPYVGNAPIGAVAGYFYEYTASASQTTFAAIYAPGWVDVFLDGLLLPTSAYTATNGTQVVLGTPCTGGEVVQIRCYGPVGTAGFYSQAEADATFLTPADANAAYAPIARARQNLLINGSFVIWQRGTSQTANGYGCADRWRFASSGAAHSASQQAFTLGQTDVAGEPEFFVRNAVTAGSTAAHYSVMQHWLEDVRTAAGQTVTVSFDAKADASRPIAMEFSQWFGTGGSPSTEVHTPIAKQTLSSTWARYSFTVDLPSISGKTLGSDGNDSLVLQFFFDAGTDFDARLDTLGHQSGTFDIANVKLEIGDTATDFEKPAPADELVRCMRYYQISGAGGGRALWSGNVTSGSMYYIDVPFRVVMRKAPTVTATHNAAAGFPATAGGPALQDTRGFQEGRTANATQSGAYFASTWTADAELP